MPFDMLSVPHFFYYFCIKQNVMRNENLSGLAE
jgi:hypothetical protein